MYRFDSLVHATDDGIWPVNPRFDASLQRLLAEMDRAEVSRACLVALADHIPNESVLQMSRQHPTRFVPIGSLNPLSFLGPDDVMRATHQLAQQGYAGLKLHPRLNGYDPLHEFCKAAMQAAGACGLPVFLDTLFRQPAKATPYVADVIDILAKECPKTSVVLLHGGGASMLELFEIIRLHERFILDLSFSLLRYEGSSLDADIRFVCRELDQRTVVGSDFPQYVPLQAFERFDQLTSGIAEAKRQNILFGNLTELFLDWTARLG